MSDLQIGLILIGIVLILAVLVFNWWQDRRLQKAMQKHFSEHEHDPLMGDTNTSSGAVRLEPAFDSLIDTEAEAGTESYASKSIVDDIEEVDAAIEVVIDISFTNPVDSVELFAELKNLHLESTKPMRIFAETANGEHRSKLRAGESYASIQIAVLLANRSGPITDIEWCRVWVYAQDVADKLDGSIEGPEYNVVVKKAQQLDATCANLDGQVGLIIQLVNALPPEQVITTLKQQGFVEQGANMVLPSDHHAPYFTALFNGLSLSEISDANVSRVDFVLDLPNSPTDEAAFSRMANKAREIASLVGANVLDDNNEFLPENADSIVDKQLASIYENLEQAGFIAGDARTMRVFS